LRIMLSSTVGELPSSKFCRLLLPGDSGATTLCGRLSFTGVSKALGGLIFMPWRATGSSLAPGGTVLLLGLPCGVLAGVMKLLRVGVEGRASVLSCFPPPGNRLAMKLAMVPERSAKSGRKGRSGMRCRAARGPPLPLLPAAG
jgi:hypothetical protein